MGFFKTAKEDVAVEGVSNYIKTSGIYTLKFKACEVASTRNGATQLNYYADRINIFGQIVATAAGKNTDKNGKKLSGFGAAEALSVILNTVDEEGDTGFCDPEEITVKMSKGPKELTCLDQVTDTEVQAWIQFEYQMYEGKIQERINIKRFYDAENGGSGSEILALQAATEKGTAVATNMVIGTQIAKDTAYASEVKYSESSKGAGDAPTEADVIAWKKANASGGNASTAAATPAKPKNNPFAK